MNSHPKKYHARPNISKILFKNKLFFILKNKVHLYKTKNIDELE